MIPEGIGEWPRHRAITSAGHPAIVFRDQVITYGELADRTDRIAAALQGAGAGPGTRIAFLGDNHPAFIETLFASAKLGSIFVPLNTRSAVPELAYMLSDSDTSIFVSTSCLEPLAGAAVRAAEVAEPALKIRRIVVDDPKEGDPVSLAEDAQDYELLLSGARTPADSPRITLEDRAMIIYTSGTTGRPKGAVLSHGNLTWNAINVVVDYDIVSTDRALMVSPLFHVASLGMGCLPILLKGATVLLEERFVAGDALRTIERLRATTLSGVPTTFQLMAQDPAWASTDISSLRLLTCGGSAIPDRIRDAYEGRGLAFSGGYGMTETSPGITMLPPWHAASRPGSSGLAHFFTRFRIRDTETGRIPASGSRGEIEASGPNVFLEYWRRPEDTAAVFTEDGWLKTGDIGYTDDDGFLYIQDRVKDMIISGGENIYSAEVEQAILAIEGVTGVAVIGVPHEKWGEAPHAVVTLAAGARLNPETMVAELSTRLARYKIPRTIEVVAELPRTATGKIQKQILRVRYDRESRSEE